MLHSIHQQMEGTRPDSPSGQGVEEVGPGLDFFSLRKLFFGDLADTQGSANPSDLSTILLDIGTSKRLLERYLATYWHGLPYPSKEEYRQALDEMFAPPAVLNGDAPDRIILLLAMSLGAFMLGEASISDLLLRTAKQGMVKLDEVVNVQMVQIYLMMISKRDLVLSFRLTSFSTVIYN